MIFYLEQERDTCRSSMLYKSYLKWLTVTVYLIWTDTTAGTESFIVIALYHQYHKKCMITVLFFFFLLFFFLNLATLAKHMYAGVSLFETFMETNTRRRAKNKHWIQFQTIIALFKKNIKMSNLTGRESVTCDWCIGGWMTSNWNSIWNHLHSYGMENAHCKPFFRWDTHWITQIIIYTKLFEHNLYISYWFIEY